MRDREIGDDTGDKYMAGGVQIALMISNGT